MTKNVTNYIGEGSKPIFDREEIKKAAKINEVEERRTVVAVNGEQSVSTSKSQTSKKHSSSLSPILYISEYLSSHQSRYRADTKQQDNRAEFRDHHKNNGRNSIEKHREYKEKYTERDAHKYNTNRSRSRERDSRKSHTRPLMEERSYRDRYRDRSSEHSRERRDRDKDRDRDRDRSRERRDVAPHYIEPPIHVPIYYNLPPRPIVESPMVPFRGQVSPMGIGRHSALMAPIRPFPPRFIPPDMYRLGPPPPYSNGAEHGFWPDLPEVIEPPHHIDRLLQYKKDYDNVPSAPHYIDTPIQRAKDYPAEDISNIPYANTQSKYTESTPLTPFEDREANPHNLTYRHRHKSKFPIAGLDNLRPIDERFCLNNILNRNSSLSSPVECARSCRKGDRKICYYNFVVEYYMVNGMACRLCIPNATNALCSDCECVPADGIERSANIVNRQLPGPAIEVCEGDHVVIDVTNHMSGSELTIHWHGVFQKEFQYYDGVPHVTQCPIPNDNTFRYQWGANNPGTHFWHAHSGLQKMDGVFGSLIIRQSPEHDPHSHLYDYDLSTHVLIINDWMHEQAVAHYPGKRNPFNEIGQNPDAVLINGKGRYTDRNTGITTNTTLEVIDVEPGKRYRIRIINAFCTVCPGVLTIQNHNLSVIATDGISVKPRTVDSITSFAGERYDIVLDANKPIGSYWIQVRAIGICAADGIQQLAILRYKGASNESLQQPPDYSEDLSQGIDLNPLNANCEEPSKDKICVSELSSVGPIDKDILRLEPDIKFYLPVGFYAYTLQELFQPNTYDRFMVAQGRLALAGIIDGISFKFPPSPPLSQPMDISKDQYCNRNNIPENCNNSVCACTQKLDIPLNAIVEIVLVDEVQGVNLSHPFHMHGYAFYVMGMGSANVSSINWQLVEEMDKRNLVYRCFDNPVRKDTIAIPYNGYVVLRFRADNPGYWLFHCHFIYHQIVGMEMLLKVGNQKDVPPVPRNFPKCGQYLPTIGYNAYPPLTQSTYKP